MADVLMLKNTYGSVYLIWNFYKNILSAFNHIE